MATNKNALIRYKHLDMLLSDRHHYYDINDLTEKVNEMLYDDGFKTVTRRCIEKDLVYLTERPFCAPIERTKRNGKNCVFYKNASFSIFKQEMSREERNLLREVLTTIGQFDGLDNFEWLEKFKIGLGYNRHRQIISFSNNPYLKNSNLLGTLFDYISNKVVIRLYYHTFSNKTTRSFEFHPYLLKQVNNRWFILGTANNDGTILTFALDRIDKVEPLPEKKYKECHEDLNERFEDIVGITYHANRPVSHILFWCSNDAQDYVITKPLHGSQIQYHGEEEKRLHAQYSSLEGGSFFSIDCIENFELITLLCSYGKDLIVLEPSSIRDDIFNRITIMVEEYLKV
ncbi:MAG: WYL domain-containing protein [Prevotella sp.]|nr:WYL domain-containing protein [Prevotella sp.]